MTIVAGVVDKNGDVFMGCDSIGTNGFIYSCREEPKIFKNGDFLIGYTTSFRFGQLLEHSFKPPRHHKKDSDYKYMCTHFIDEVRKCLKGGGYAKKDKEEESGGTCLIGYHEALWEMKDDYEIAKAPGGIGAVGSGSYTAYGAMHALKRENPKVRIKAGLEAAEAIIVTTRGPFHYMKLKAG